MSEAEDTLATQMELAGLPTPERQCRFVPNRRFAADFAWRAHGLIVEVQGGGWGNGRHHRATGYAADCLRMGHALALGWRVLYVTTDQVASGEALQMVQSALCAPVRPWEAQEAPTRPKRTRRVATAKLAPASPLVSALMDRTGCTRARAEEIEAHNARGG